jgi:hypothetical protein
VSQNSAVVDRISVPKPSKPEQRPDPHVDLRALPDTEIDVAEYAQTDAPTGILWRDLLEALTQAVDEAARAKTERLARPSWGALVYTRDDAGCFVVQDLTGAVYGSGHTREEALADFESSLRDRFSFLREHEASLAPRLARELRVLARLFPHIV